jgi:hypothetical protein
MKVKAERAIALRLAGNTEQQIADILGYKNESGVSKLITRYCEKSIASNIEEMRKIQGMRLEKLWSTFFPEALNGDIKSAEQCKWIDASVQRLFGLTAQDGVWERMAQIEEAKVILLASVLSKILDDLDLTPAQKKKAPAIVESRMKEISG